MKAEGRGVLGEDSESDGPDPCMLGRSNQGVTTSCLDTAFSRLRADVGGVLDDSTIGPVGGRGGRDSAGHGSGRRVEGCRSGSTQPGVVERSIADIDARLVDRQHLLGMVGGHEDDGDHVAGHKSVPGRRRCCGRGAASPVSVVSKNSPLADTAVPTARWLRSATNGLCEGAPLDALAGRPPADSRRQVPVFEPPDIGDVESHAVRERGSELSAVGGVLSATGEIALSADTPGGISGRGGAGHVSVTNGESAACCD